MFAKVGCFPIALIAYLAVQFTITGCALQAFNLFLLMLAGQQFFFLQIIQCISGHVLSK